MSLLLILASVVTLLLLVYLLYALLNAEEVA